MGFSETYSQNRKTPMTNHSDYTIKIEDFGNGIFIKWKIKIH